PAGHRGPELCSAGDGGHLHPTQTLTDLVTLSYEKGRLDNLTIGLCGDNKNGRTVHSLIKSLSKYPNNKFVLISTEQLQVPKYVLDCLKANGASYSFSDSLEESIGELDVLYMTRIQRERFSSQAEYDAQKGVFVLDAHKMSLAKKDLRVLHPLPRVDEIAVEVDDDPRAKYFEQTEYGIYARMALIIKMLENRRNVVPDKVESTHDARCGNMRCITQTESYLPALFDEREGELVCRYCDHAINL
ncbi:MAG TPA: aspartate carbamoyltransferase, partial [Oscillospiraceae bacterium]|nr:aspartate carbamoyltransferase [Oscillospiraceae bacterium]